MAITRYAGDRFVGSSLDPKPTGVMIGAMFYEYDTLRTYLLNTGATGQNTTTGWGQIIPSGVLTYTDSGNFVNTTGGTGQFYPLKSNPSGFMISGGCPAFREVFRVNNSGGFLSGQSGLIGIPNGYSYNTGNPTGLQVFMNGVLQIIATNSGAGDNDFWTFNSTGVFFNYRIASGSQITFLNLI